MIDIHAVNFHGRKNKKNIWKIIPISQLNFKWLLVQRRYLSIKEIIFKTLNLGKTVRRVGLAKNTNEIKKNIHHNNIQIFANQYIQLSVHTITYLFTLENLTVSQMSEKLEIIIKAINAYVKFVWIFIILLFLLLLLFSVYGRWTSIYIHYLFVAVSFLYARFTNCCCRYYCFFFLEFFQFVFLFSTLFEPYKNESFFLTS